MPTMKLTFPGGRYHATPWGHHVNEGQIEWPPSPWRLLRAFIAVGYATQHWDEVPEVGRRVIERLAAHLPEYRLPPASSAHSRHYMPVGKLGKSQLENTTLVFDTWANVEDGGLIVRWDCELDDECQQMFHTLVENLGYLGRSESWVEASVIGDDDLSHLGKEDWTIPHRDGVYRGPDWEQVQLIASTSAEAYTAWRTQETESLLSEYPVPEGKKPPKPLQKKREAAVAGYPTDLIDCLQKDTTWWKKEHHWSQPPGSQRVLYWRRNDALVVSHPSRPKPNPSQPVEAMLLALATPSRNKSALPSVTRTLPQAELFHRAIVGIAGNGQRVQCPELTGKDEFGKALQTNHQHAHTLPLDLDGDGHLDHILLWAPMGLGADAQTAIGRLKRIWTKKSKDNLQVSGVGDQSLDADLRELMKSTDDLQVSVVGRGNLSDLWQLPESIRKGITQILGTERGTTCWVSATPYVAPRFLKMKGQNTLEGQIQSELKSRYGTQLANLEILHMNKPHGENKIRRFRHYQRVRNHGGRNHGGRTPPVDKGYALKIQTAIPIKGPLCLGYASHFGLGMFVTSASEQAEN